MPLTSHGGLGSVQGLCFQGPPPWGSPRVAFAWRCWLKPWGVSRGEVQKEGTPQENRSADGLWVPAWGEGPRAGQREEEAGGPASEVEVDEESAEPRRGVQGGSSGQEWLQNRDEP